MQNTVYLQLGSNVGDGRAIFNASTTLLQLRGLHLLRMSGLYSSEPWGNTTQAPFLNKVLVINTDLQARDVLDICLTVEQELGRTRHNKWEPRTIDIDILFFNDEVILSPELTVPHPHICERRFILTMMTEIAELYIHPVERQSMKDLLNICKDKLKVTLIS